MIEFRDRAVADMFAKDPGGGHRGFADMVRDPECQAANHLHAEAIVEAVPQPTVPVGA